MVILFHFQLPDWYNPFYFTAVTLLYTNSALNPVLYGGLNDNFRSGLKNLINSIFRRKRILTNSNGVTRNSVISTIHDNRRNSEVNILSDLHLDPKETTKKKISYGNPLYEEEKSSEWRSKSKLVSAQKAPSFFIPLIYNVNRFLPSTGAIKGTYFRKCWDFKKKRIIHREWIYLPMLYCSSSYTVFHFINWYGHENFRFFVLIFYLPHFDHI